MTGNRVLVTGGAGYIGSHTAKALAKAGFEPVVFDDLSTGHRYAVRWGPLVEETLASPAAIAAALERYQPMAVVHFAAHAYVAESVANPAIYYRNNAVNTLNLLDAMHSHGIDNFVFSSTCATYGLPRRLPLDESHPQRPISPYGHSKLFVEGVLEAYDRAYGLRSVALRYFNAAGADPDGELGEDHEPETHLLPVAMQVALGQRARLEVYGSDYPTHDGTAIRDYIHVSDLARAHVLALRYLLDGGGTTALNLGVGKGFSVREAVEAIERVTGRGVELAEYPRREGDPPVLVADARRGRQVLGWSPRYTDLDEIVATAWRWHRARHEKEEETKPRTVGLVTGPQVRPE